MRFNLHEAIAPSLAALGFRLHNKQFHGRSGSVPMRVWFNPENRLNRIRTISIDCGMPDSDMVLDSPLYIFDQAYAASGDWRKSYTPSSPGWPKVMASDFEEFTVPFIRNASSGEAILDMLLSGTIPPQHGPVETSIPIYALRIARRLGLSSYEQRVVEYVGSRRYDLSEYQELRDWAKREGLRIHLRMPFPRVLPRR